ncbi:MAG: DUF3298 and DUF4163 domain-containing protein [Eudoraea sp.]|nr:DUF3298 and DUF4163 domain-containing protein [Eudoraea sp.]
MRLFLRSLVILLFLSGCYKSNSLALENIKLESNRCEQCPLVLINIPKAIDNDRISKTINSSLREEIIAELTFYEEDVVENIEDAITSFTTGYKEIQLKHPEEVTPWEAKINAEVSYEDRQMITIKLDTYLFTGGAHGYGATRFLNFNKSKGSEIADWELFDNKEDFARFAENKFRKQEKIPQGKSINSTGYMFESDAFYLPENIGFTQEGIKLLYNQYEVASFADGPIELVLPYKEVNKYLSGEIKS